MSERPNDEGDPAPSPRQDPARERPTPRDDEVTLRDLYLVLRRGIGLIAVVTVVAVALAFAWVLIQPDVYEAEATVVSSPTTVQLQREGTLSFEPRSAVTFATYQDIAASRATLEDALDRIREASVEPPASVLDLDAAGELVRLAGPGGGGDANPLTVVHRVAWGEAERAAAYADAWAAATVEQVRSSLLANLEPARERTLAAIDDRQEDLEAAEAAFQAFQTKDLAGVRGELQEANAGLLELRAERRDMSQSIAGANARREMLLGTAESAEGVGVDDAVLDLLEGTERLNAGAAARLRALAPPSVGTGDSAGAVAALLATADLHNANLALATLLQERATVDASLRDLETRVAVLRERVAELEAERIAVQRRLDDAGAAYQAVRSIEPALAFVAELTPGNTRVLNAAEPPVEPVGTSLIRVALLAAVVAALASTLFVLLREAVRDPGERVAAA